MTIKDINDIIKAVCPNDEDYEKPCISPKYLRQELEQLALDQEQKMVEHKPEIDKSAMMQEIYMEGVNMAGEYQGCWVRFKEIEKIVDRYVR